MTETETIKEIEEDARELRLTEQAFSKNAIRNVKKRHRKIILRVVIALACLALVLAIFACPLLHSVHLCPWMR